MASTRELAVLHNAVKAQADALSAHEFQELAAEYGALAAVGAEQASSVSQLEGNAGKNRYRNILAYDHSRVQLTGLLDDSPPGPSSGPAGTSGYINASWVGGCAGPRSYIASQGPIPDTFPAFWHMVWQEKCEVIVMVTREVEKGVLKCHRYWPDPSSEPPSRQSLYSLVEVRHVRTTARKFFTEREFELTRGSQSRKLVQFAYESWPDHGVPLTAKEFLQFRAHVNAHPTAHPVLVHCSAGVGRTGTYIATDLLLGDIERGNVRCDIKGAVRTLRLARNHMVQSQVQYFFVYRVVLSAIRAMVKAKKQRQEAAKAKATPEELSSLEEAMEKETVREEDGIRTLMHDSTQKLDTLGVDNQAADAAEVAAASSMWEQDRGSGQTEYAVTRSLTSMQSRLESLATMGVKLTPASQAQIKQIIAAAKAIRAQHKQAALAQEQKEDARHKQQAAQAKTAADLKVKQARRSKAEAKASAYLRKMSDPNLTPR